MRNLVQSRTQEVGDGNVLEVARKAFRVQSYPVRPRVAALPIDVERDTLLILRFPAAVDRVQVWLSSIARCSANTDLNLSFRASWDALEPEPLLDGHVVLASGRGRDCFLFQASGRPFNCLWLLGSLLTGTECEATFQAIADWSATPSAAIVRGTEFLP